MARRGDAVYKRKDGLWEARYIKEIDIYGKKKYGSVYAHTYREAKEKRQAVTDHMLLFQSIPPVRQITIGKLVQEWLQITIDDGSGTSYTDQQSVTDLATTAGETVTLYAQWELIDDEGPAITAVDRWFTLEEAQSGEVITFEELMSTAFAEDDNTDFSAGEGIFTMIDYNSKDFTSFKAAGSVTVTYYAQDKSGHEAYQTATVYIIDKDVPSIKDNGDDSDSPSNEGIEGSAKEVSVRFISQEYYLDDVGGFVDASAGGLLAGSKWKSDNAYVVALTNALRNSCSDGNWSVAPVYSFTLDRATVDANGQKLT